MRRERYRESTIQPCIRALKAIAKRSNLPDPESVKAYLASSQLSENRKEKVCDDLARFYRYKGMHFDRPRYRRVEKLPFIPLQSEIDQLISGVGKKTATFLQLLKETAIHGGVVVAHQGTHTHKTTPLLLLESPVSLPLL